MAEHAEMDWIPVNLDSPEGDRGGGGGGQSNKVSEPDDLIIKNRGH